MKIIVDTNVIFSALLNTNGTIGDLLFVSDKVFQFYSCTYMRYEIEKHWAKLKHIPKLTDTELNDSLFRLYTKIHFINEELIPEYTWLKAEDLAKEIDPDDIDFIALTEHLKGTFWTGDKELYIGLKSKNYRKVVNTSELLQLRIKKTK